MITKRSHSWGRWYRAGVIALAVVLASAAVTLAQNQIPQPPAQDNDYPAAVSSLRLEIVLLRRDAKKVNSRVPYVFSLSGPGSSCRLRMGAQVPVPALGPDGPLQYKDIGTNIDCTVAAASSGRYRITISIEDSSVLGNDMIEPSATAKFGNMPIFRSYQSTNTVVLRNGETAQFTAAADRVSGETVSAEVTLTVLK